MTLKIVAVDSGKHLTKAVRIEDSVFVDRFSIDTKMIPTMEELPRNASSYVVEHNGRRFSVGNRSSEYNAVTSKAQDVHKYATYLAVSQMVEDGDKVALAIGCPLSLYINKSAREEYMKFMMNLDSDTDAATLKTAKPLISLIVNGQPFSFTIEHLYIVPETSGFLIKYEEDYIGRDVAIIDIGGLNVNGAIYETVTRFDRGVEQTSIQMIEDSIFTLEDGGNVFATKLMDRLNEKYDAGISPNQMPRIIKEGYIKLNKEESAETIKEFKANFFENIKHRMKLRNWSIKTLDLIFVGGGSLLFEEDILSEPDFIDPFISGTAQWDNSEGFAFIAEDDVFAKQA